MAWLKRLYFWVLTWADHPAGPAALFVLSFFAATVFPIPADVLLIALCLASVQRAFWFAALCTVGSVLGGMSGYLVGKYLWERVSEFVFLYVPGFTPEVFEEISRQFEQHSFWIVFTAAFTPVPYRVFTVSAGVAGISLLTFTIASVIGRGARFYLIAALMWKFGKPMKEFIETYFEILTVAITILIFLSFAVLKQLM